MTNIPATLHSAALAYAAEQLEATGERGTLDAIVLLGQLAAAAAPRPFNPSELQRIPVIRHAEPREPREWRCDLTFAGGDGMLLDSVRAVDVRGALEQFCRHPRYLEAVRVMVAEIS